jgi:hypothetical protein
MGRASLSRFEAGSDTWKLILEIPAPRVKATLGFSEEQQGVI